MKRSAFETRYSPPDMGSSTSQNGFITWFVSVVTTLLIGGLLYCGNLVIDGAFQKIRFAGLSRKLNSNLPLEEIVKDPRYSQMIKPQKTILDQLAIVDRLVAEEKFNRAMTNTRDFAQLPLPSARNLVAELRAATGVEEQAEEINNQLAACEQQEALLKQRYRDISQKLGTLLGIDVALKSIRMERNEQGLYLPLYQSGILANLPVLSDLPDDIRDTDRLMASLSEQHRKDLPIDLARRKTSLGKELERLREESDKMVASVANLIKQQSTTEDYRSAMLLTSKTHRDGISQYIRNTVRELLTPNLKPRQAHLIGIVCRQLDGVCDPGTEA